MNEKVEQALVKVKEEGSKKEFEYRGYKCLVYRHPEIGHLCGYVQIPKGHEYYGNRDYDSIPVDCHGGLTFSAEKDDGSWYIGFDCAHAGDLCPLMEAKWSTSTNYAYVDEDYRDMEYVIKECKKIVDQLKK